MFCRGWNSAGPPHPELLPDIDDSDGANAIHGALHVGPATDPSPRYRKDASGTPICGQRTEIDDGYAPEPVHAVAYGAPPRRRMNDMTTDYDHDAHAASYDAPPPRAADDVESGYAPGRVSDGYTRAQNAATRRAMPRRASDGAVTQILQVGRTSDTGFDESYAPGCVNDYAPDSFERACRPRAKRLCRRVATL